MKYIDADRLRKEIEEERKSIEGLFIEGDNNFYDGQDDAYNHTLALIDSLQQEQDLIVINKKDWEAQEQFRKNKDFGKPIQQEQPTLNESQQEFVNIVTERMLKEGPIPTLKGKQKAEFEKEFNRFKQITGMINFPAHMEVYKRIILWFMAWGADNLPNLGKPIDPGRMDIQQEQPELPQIERAEYYYHKGVYEGLSQGRADALKILDEFMKRQANPVIVIEQQEQPEVDLEKEYKEYVEDDPVFRKLTNRNVGFAIARHFYELGLKSK